MPLHCSYGRQPPGHPSPFFYIKIWQFASNGEPTLGRPQFNGAMQLVSLAQVRPPSTLLPLIRSFHPIIPFSPGLLHLLSPLMSSQFLSASQRLLAMFLNIFHKQAVQSLMALMHPLARNVAFPAAKRREHQPSRRSLDHDRPGPKLAPPRMTGLSVPQTPGIPGAPGPTGGVVGGWGGGAFGASESMAGFAQQHPHQP